MRGERPDSRTKEAKSWAAWAGNLRGQSGRASHLGSMRMHHPEMLWILDLLALHLCVLMRVGRSALFRCTFGVWWSLWQLALYSLVCMVEWFC